MSKLIDIIKNHGKKHLVDSTAILVASNPVFSAMETQISGMSNDVSINARLLSALQIYGGFGFLYSKGRDVSRRIFHVSENSSERLQQFHDASYTAAYNLVFAPLLYIVSGERDLKKIAIGTATATAFGLFLGGPMGYAVDAFRDLTGLESSNRLPSLIKNQAPKLKLGLAALATAASVGAMAAIYQFNR